MPTPFKRHSRHRTMNRRNKNWTLKSEAHGKCSNCGAAKPGHAVCPGCGFYNGKLVLPKKTRKSKKDKNTGGESEES